MTRKSLAVRLDSAERETLGELAKACGMPIAEYLRRTGLHQKVRPLPRLPEINLQTYSELGRIGSNINQIAANLNRGLDPNAGAQRIASALPKLYELIQETRRQLIQTNAEEDDK